MSFLPGPWFLHSSLSCSSAAHTGYPAQVTASWDPNSEATLAGYKIYYGTQSRSYTFSIDVGNQTSYIITGLAAGTKYFFAATAYDKDGNETDYSEEVIYTIPATTTTTIPGNCHYNYNRNNYYNYWLQLYQLPQPLTTTTTIPGTATTTITATTTTTRLKLQQLLKLPLPPVLLQKTRQTINHQLQMLEKIKLYCWVQLYLWMVEGATTPIETSCNTIGRLDQGLLNIYCKTIQQQCLPLKHYQLAHILLL